jgi:hypothetical protein
MLSRLVISCFLLFILLYPSECEECDARHVEEVRRDLAEMRRTINKMEKSLGHIDKRKHKKKEEEVREEGLRESKKKTRWKRKKKQSWLLNGNWKLSDIITVDGEISYTWILIYVILIGAIGLVVYWVYRNYQRSIYIQQKRLRDHYQRELIQIRNGGHEESDYVPQTSKSLSQNQQMYNVPGYF